VVTRKDKNKTQSAYNKAGKGLDCIKIGELRMKTTKCSLQFPTINYRKKYDKSDP
jgi:hypothetical protein